MKSLSKMVLITAALTSLLACQAPNASEGTTKTGNNDTAGSSANVGVGIGVDIGGGSTTDSSTSSGSSSTSANSELTVNAKGTIYTYGKIKSFYECVAANSSNAAFKSTASATVSNLNEVDASADTSDDKAAYTKAALGVSTTRGFSGTECNAS